MPDNPRIEELRRRVHEEPASIAFAQLAEELRRSSQFLEAVTVCRDGLEIYPGYLSVRVTLGRCLIELDRLDDAEQELERVRETAPDNLAAMRALSKIQQRRDAAIEARSGGVAVQSPADVQPKPDVTSAAQAASNAQPVVAAVALVQAPLDLVTPYVERLIHVEVPATRRAQPISEDEYMRVIRRLTALEAWLAAIHVARSGRSA